MNDFAAAAMEDQLDADQNTPNELVEASDDGLDDTMESIARNLIEEESKEWLECFREDKYLSFENKTREARAITRTSCEASFRIVKCKDNGMYRVKAFQSEHNHRLARSPQKPFLRSHQNLQGGTREVAKMMKHAGIRTCHIWPFLIQQAGGWDKVGCTKKDLYNGLQNDNKNSDDCDAAAAVAYLLTKKEAVEVFFL
ncbi:hypothetical protein Sjap_004478 [Stephania japonica]|uniref:FAR1 domain-containing protein n=1 Tax=Stephania japonica TaxID=461633 RepID=A0AAP0K3B8_9MAGN